MKYLLLPLVFCLIGCQKNSTLIATPSKETRALSAGWGKDGSWMQQKDFIDKMCIEKDTVAILMIGNSITQSWGSENRGALWGPGFAVRKNIFQGYDLINAGIAGDRVEHILWRLQNGQMQSVFPKYITLAVGVNNFKHNTADEISEGIINLVSHIRKDFTTSKIILFGLLPTGKKPNSPHRTKYNRIQKNITEQINPNAQIIFYNATQNFTLQNGDLNPQLYAKDGIHLTKEGYEKWGEIILNIIDKN